MSIVRDFFFDGWAEFLVLGAIIAAAIWTAWAGHFNRE